MAMAAELSPAPPGDLFDTAPASVSKVQEASQFVSATSPFQPRHTGGDPNVSLPTTYVLVNCEERRKLRERGVQDIATAGPPALHDTSMNPAMSV